jgi:hypothetical protein
VARARLGEDAPMLSTAPASTPSSRRAPLAAAILAPHSKTAPDPKKLIGLDDHVPRHRTQDLDALKRLQADLG